MSIFYNKTMGQNSGLKENRAHEAKRRGDKKGKETMKKMARQMGHIKVRAILTTGISGQTGRIRVKAVLTRGISGQTTGRQ